MSTEGKREAKTGAFGVGTTALLVGMGIGLGAANEQARRARDPDDAPKSHERPPGRVAAWNEARATERRARDAAFNETKAAARRARDTDDEPKSRERSPGRIAAVERKTWVCKRGRCTNINPLKEVLCFGCGNDRYDMLAAMRRFSPPPAPINESHLGKSDIAIDLQKGISTAASWDKHTDDVRAKRQLTLPPLDSWFYRHALHGDNPHMFHAYIYLRSKLTVVITDQAERLAIAQFAKELGARHSSCKVFTDVVDAWLALPSSGRPAFIAFASLAV